MKKAKARAVLIDGNVYRKKADGSLVPLKGKTDWKRLDRQTSTEVEAIAANDREGAPMTDVEWAKAEVMQPDSQPPKELLEGISIDRVLRADITTAVELMVMSGRSDEAKSLLPRLLEHNLQRGREEELVKVGVLFASHGQSEEFEKVLRGRMHDDDMTDHILRDVKRGGSRRRPYR